MKTVRIVKEAGDGSATSWTVTAEITGESDRVYSFTGAQSVDASFTCDGLTIERDSVDVTPAIAENRVTVYLRDTVQVFGSHDTLEPVAFGVWCLFFAFIVTRILH